MMRQLKKNRKMEDDKKSPRNETAVDDQQISENGRIYKIDKKVSFKCHDPQLVLRFEIKLVKSQSTSPKLHGEFFFKNVQKDIGRTLLSLPNGQWGS